MDIKVIRDSTGGAVVYAFLSPVAFALEMAGTMLVAKAAVIIVAKLMSGTAIPVK